MKLNIIIKNVICQKLKLKIDLKIIKLEDYVLKQIHLKLLLNMIIIIYLNINIILIKMN